MASTIPGGAVQYMTFRIGNEEFAFDIAKVRDVLDFTTLTKVPNAPEFVRGMIHPGLAVRVVDLRLAFGMAKTEKTMETCVIIGEVAADGETSVLGLPGKGSNNEKIIIVLDMSSISFAEELFPVHESEYVPYGCDSVKRQPRYVS